MTMLIKRTLFGAPMRRPWDGFGRPLSHNH